MVDFSERRPEIWRNLTARLYRVHSWGPGNADVTEGTALPGVDVGERVTYEWTDSVVRGVLTEGRIFRPGGTFEFPRTARRRQPDHPGLRPGVDDAAGTVPRCGVPAERRRTHQANLPPGVRHTALIDGPPGASDDAPAPWPRRMDRAVAGAGA